MNTQDVHRIKIGAMLWADNWLCNRGQGYTTTSQRLYPQVDHTIPDGYVAYASPYKGWVFDSGVDGAHIPNSISGSSGTISAGQSGLQFDYSNGRVFLTGVSSNLNLTGTFSFKDFNIYASNENVEQLLIDSKDYLNPKWGNNNTGIAPYAIATPCAFINISQGKNTPKALGGLKNKNYTLSMVVLSESDWQLDGFLGLMNNASEKCFPALGPEFDPEGPYGILKSGYDYSVIQETAPTNDYVYIESVNSSKFRDYEKINDRIYVGFVEMDLSLAGTT